MNKLLLTLAMTAGLAGSAFAADLPATDFFMAMPDGQAVFALAVEMMSESSRRAMAMAGLGAAAIDRFVPHQANTRIFETVRRNLGLPSAAIVSTIAEFGNSSAATIPFSLAASAEATPLRSGERLLLSAAGAGMTGGAVVFGI